MDVSKTFQLRHTYAIDGDPDDVRTVAARCVDFDRPGANYVILSDPRGELSIYPVELDSDGENLLTTPGDLSFLDDADVDRDGNVLPIWVPVIYCEDVTADYPDPFSEGC